MFGFSINRKNEKKQKDLAQEQMYRDLYTRKNAMLAAALTEEKRVDKVKKSK